MSKLLILWLYTDLGWTSRFSIRSFGLSNRGSFERLADAQTSEKSPRQANLRHHGPVSHRTVALGGQLRPFVRILVRFPVELCSVAVRVIRTIRPSSKSVFDMGVSAHRTRTFRCPDPVVLYHPCI